ncbi:phosphohistidine phosphatase SixA [bacterium]|jgi:phosphohistidine phosphatase|nr:phosphohistidine phosphatase SixA [bacterium]MBT3580681.1 phosphohistidine phosphatase SixA [bacterium]MBT4552216.1 phosphohistidine phosphatase SixA [bacterium]MBT5988285.1 phosphohistidine phosphatase SixA [bacterium]MBT7088278.1 phosphohistidine phosphatase SixA [bacterium]
MKLYLVRHGNALNALNRPLSSRGIAEAKLIAKFIKPLHLQVHSIWHSDKARSIQTTEIMALSLKSLQEKIQKNNLAPNNDIETIKNDIDLETKDLMIVGHLPYLSTLASSLLFNKELPTLIPFKELSILCLNHAGKDQWELEWMVEPGLLKN